MWNYVTAWIPWICFASHDHLLQFNLILTNVEHFGQNHMQRILCISTPYLPGAIQLFQPFSTSSSSSKSAILYHNYENWLRFFCRIVKDRWAFDYFIVAVQLLAVQFTPPRLLCFCFEYAEAMNNFACFTHTNVLMCFRNFLIIYSQIIVERFSFLDCQSFDIQHGGYVLQHRQQ